MSVVENHDDFVPIKARSNRRLGSKKSCTILIALLILVFIVFVLYILLRLRRSHVTPPIQYCSTQACILTGKILIYISRQQSKKIIHERIEFNLNAANTIIKNMNPNVDPCEDFNEFSCGNFINNSNIPSEQTKLDIFDILRNNLAINIAGTLFVRLFFDFFC